MDLADADIAWQMMGAVADPLIRSSFESVYANALALSARYDEALEAATSLLSTAERYRLDFAIPYGLCSAAMAYAGHRNWRSAERCLSEASRHARLSRNLHAEQSAFAVLIRTVAQQGRHESALAIPVPELRSSLLAMKAEVVTSRALVLASASRLDEASAALAEVEGLSQSIEQAVLTAATTAIIKLRRNDDLAMDTVVDLEEVAFSTGALDLLVAAYRAAPELLSVLLR